MTDHDELHALKLAAKQLVRGLDVPHHNALNIIAERCGHPHWIALRNAYNNGWRPTFVQLENAESLMDDIEAQSMVEPYDEEQIKGELKGHPYTLTFYPHDVLISGQRWGIHLGHAPSEPAGVEKYGPCAIDDPEVMAEAMALLLVASDELRERIKEDRPESSTSPAPDGSAMHPLSGAVSKEWHCLHCDTKSTGVQMAANFWHCPKCSATPIDIHASTWWKKERVKA